MPACLALLALGAHGRFLDRAEADREHGAAGIVQAADTLRVALLGHAAGAGLHVDDVVHLLGPLGGVVEGVPHHVDLARDESRQQAGPAAQLELDLDARAREDGAREVGVVSDHVVEILGHRGTRKAGFAGPRRS